jgi:two-component system alkaline phosphatase synthesis response regulator PhoP
MNLLFEHAIRKIQKSNKDTFTKDEIIELLSDRDESILPTIESNGVLINPTTFEVTYNGVKQTPPKKVFILLYYLISNKNKVLRREKILSHIWGDDVFVGNRTIDVHIRKLRGLINDSCIVTQKGVGYMWQDK